jgi:hypothetical protein
VTVSAVDSQWLEPETLGSVEVKVTSQETLSLAVTLKVVLFDATVAVEAFVTVVE